VLFRSNQKPELGKNYSGLVKKILDFGAVVEILPGVDGLLHISQLAEHKVNKVEDIVKVGDTVKVKVVEIDDHGKIRLSKVAVLREENGEEIDLKDYSQPKPRPRNNSRHPHQRKR